MTIDTDTDLAPEPIDFDERYHEHREMVRRRAEIAKTTTTNHTNDEGQSNMIYELAYRIEHHLDGVDVEPVATTELNYGFFLSHRDGDMLRIRDDGSYKVVAVTEDEGILIGIYDDWDGWHDGEASEYVQVSTVPEAFHYLSSLMDVAIAPPVTPTPITTERTKDVDLKEHTTNRNAIREDEDSDFAEAFNDGCDLVWTKALLDHLDGLSERLHESGYITDAAAVVSAAESIDQLLRDGLNMNETDVLNTEMPCVAFGEGTVR